MITIKTNIGEVSDRIQQKLLAMLQKEFVRPVAFDVIDLMTKRIHVDGKDSSDGPIGTYSPRYLELREKSYARSKDPKIIVSLTRQLENDWSVIETERGYGIGFKNSHNLDKARWVETGQKKKIFSLTSGEQTYVTERIQELTREALA